MVNLWLNILDLNRWRKGFQKFFIFGTLFLLYVPLVVFILLSFNRASDKGNISTIISSERWVGIENYVEFFTDSSGSFRSSLVNSLIIALFSIPISLVIGVITSINIWKNYGRGKSLVFSFCNLSISSPDIIQAISFLVLFTVLVVPMGFNFGFMTIILSHIAISIPYVIMFIYPRLDKLHHNLLFVAYDLKFGFWETVINVIVPIIFPSILGAGLLVFTISFDDFIITNLIRGSVSTVTTELYTMKTGIKTWSSVFGSLVILVSFFSVLSFNTYKFLKERDD